MDFVVYVFWSFDLASVSSTLTGAFDGRSMLGTSVADEAGVRLPRQHSVERPSKAVHSGSSGYGKRRGDRLSFSSRPGWRGYSILTLGSIQRASTNRMGIARSMRWGNAIRRPTARLS